MTDIPERLKKTLATQIEKYGGIDGYRAEMRRRRSMVKSPIGFALMDEAKIKQAQLNSARARSRNAKNRTKAKDAIKSQD
jgi:hypothetical protein